MAKPDYDTSLARIAGNIASGIMANPFYRRSNPLHAQQTAVDALAVADTIVQLLKCRAEDSALPPAPQGTK